MPQPKKKTPQRETKRISLEVAPGKIVTLSPGDQNALVAKIIHDFCPVFTPNGKMVYVRDTDKKFAHFDESLLNFLGVKIESHRRMTDVVVYHATKNWLILIEAVISRGPMDAKRMNELKNLFKGSEAGLVFVSAFVDRKSMVKHLGAISWETEVWIAESPIHLIHFNGERFLGPYTGVR